MAHESTIKTYYSTTPGAVPTAPVLANGELGVNIADRKLWVGSAGGRVSLGAFDSQVDAPVAWFGKTDGTIGVITFESGGIGYIRGVNKANSIHTPLQVEGSAITIYSAQGVLNLTSAGGPVTIPSGGGLDATTGPVKGVSGWFGNAAGTRGVGISELDLGGGLIYGTIRGTTKAAPTTTSLGLYLNGTGVYIASTVSNMNLNSVTSLTLDGGTFTDIVAGTGSVTIKPSFGNAVMRAGALGAVRLETDAGTAKLLVVDHVSLPGLANSLANAGGAGTKNLYATADGIVRIAL